MKQLNFLGLVHEREMNGKIAATAVEKRELSRQANLLIYQLMCVHTFTCGRVLEVVTEGMRLLIREAMSFSSAGWLGSV